jgi:ABC-type branched-subunit amino acid transport system ATPase component
MTNNARSPGPDALTPFLEVDNLQHWFGGLHVIGGVSLSCPQGIVKAIIGPNGAGKTTLFNLISGSLTPVSGSIRFLGEEIAGLPPHRIAQRGVSRTFQASHLFPGMSVLENVMTGRHAASRSGFVSCMLALPRALREERAIRRDAMEILAEMGIADLAEKDGGSLPFGQQRIVEIARALAARPRLLLLDEPACGLTMRETEVMGELISGIKAKGTTVVIVEHDMSLVMGASDEVVVLSYGRKIAEGSPREIQSNPEVIEIYLGSDTEGDAAFGARTAAAPDADHDPRGAGEPGGADAQG